jgi:hypothetical protein
MLIFALEEEPFEMHDDLGLESNLQNIQQNFLGRFNVSMMMRVLHLTIFWK